VKRERLDFLADNPFYTKRFAFYVGRRCRKETIQDVARELRLDWDTVTLPVLPVPGLSSRSDHRLLVIVAATGAVPRVMPASPVWPGRAISRQDTLVSGTPCLDPAVRRSGAVRAGLAP